MKFVLWTTSILMLVSLSFALSRPWTPADDIGTGIPAPNSVQITVDKVSPGHLHLTFRSPNVKFEQVSLNKRDWTMITMDGETRLYNYGKPAVPVISRPVLLPNRGNVQLKILSADYTEYFDTDVLPQQPMAEEGKENLIGPFAYDEATYKQDSWYPGSVAELGEPGIMRDARMALLSVQPVQVNPATHTVRVYNKIEVETVPTGGIGVNEKTDQVMHPIPGYAQFYDEILGADELTELNASAMPGLMVVISRPDTIITNALKPYIDWRNRAGRQTQLVTTSTTDPVAVKTIITGIYNANNPPLEHVLLVGDGGVPEPFNMPAYNTGELSYYNDFTYTMIHGLTPMIADFFISRWSIESIQHLATMVNRSINYERNPNMTDTTWFKRGWGYACPSFPDNRNAIWFTLAQMNVRGLPSSGLRYDEHTGSVDQTLINTRCNPGLLFWAHRPSSAGQINNTHVAGITQNVNKCFVGVNITCFTSNWYGANSNAIPEQLTRNGTPSAPAGAIASVGTYGYETRAAPNVCFLSGMFYGLGGKNCKEAAGMFYEGKMRLWLNYGVTIPATARQFIYGNHIIGDVSVRLWTGVPRRIRALIPQQIPLGQNRLEFSVLQQNGTAPISGALVTAMKQNATGQNETYYRTFTDENGHVVLPLTNATAGNLYVTVVGYQLNQNLYPLVDTVAVVQAAADIGVSGYTILDDTTNGRSGNNNHQANPGETADLNIRLQNRGSTTTVSGIRATLVSTHPLVIVSNPTHTYRNLTPNDSAYGDSTYRVRLLPGLKNTDNIALRLDITATDSTLNRTLAVVLPIRSIQLSYISYTSNPTAINPGSGADINVTVKNIGGLATGTTNATMFSLSPYVSVNTPDVTFNSLPIGQNVTNPTGRPFHITANIRTIPGLIVTLGVAFVSNAISDTIYFTVPLGTRSTRDPCGPDAYGYLAYDDTDTGYTMRPTFNWVNIDSNQNYRLPISDPSVGLDTAILVRLPFRAVYYGLQYDTVTICTNGWMSFGAAREVDSSATGRNIHIMHPERAFRIPGNESVPNMLAIDLQDWYVPTYPSGGIYTYNDTTNGWFVVSWRGVAGITGQQSNRVQILIYNPARWPTPSGDCMIKFQYKDLYGTANASNPEMAYASIAITDSTLMRGIEYSYANLYQANSGASPLAIGTNINRAVLFTTSQRFITGNLTGTVRRVSDNRPVAGASVFVLNGGNSAITDTAGHYMIRDVQIGRYNVRASAVGYNPKVDTVTITENITSTLNYQLTAPGLRITLRPQDTTLSPNDSIVAFLDSTGQETTLPIFIRNTGNGPLTWNTQLLYGGSFDQAVTKPPEIVDRSPIPQTNATDDLYDQVFSFNASQAVGGDAVLSGIEFDGKYFWISGTNNYNLPHKLYKLNKYGNLIRSFNCPDTSGSFGWRSLAWDGQRYLYSSYSTYIDKIDTADGRVVQRFGIGVNPARAIAIDTAAGVLYYADQASRIYKIRLSDGAALGSLPSPVIGGLYGMAWYPYDTDGMKLYVFARDSVNATRGTHLFKVNATNGTAWLLRTLGTSTENAGGIAITPRWNPMLWTVAAVMNAGNNGSTRVALFELAFNTVWIQYSPQSDSLLPGQTDTVRVRLSSRFMPVDRYRVAIRFNTNSIIQSVNVPVVMNVVPRVDSAPDASVVIPRTFALEQNFPNPFNPTTQISFALPKATLVRLVVYNSLGREVTTIIRNEPLQAGFHRVMIDGTKWSSGIYFYRIETTMGTISKKMVLLK